MDKDDDQQDLPSALPETDVVRDDDDLDDETLAELDSLKTGSVGPDDKEVYEYRVMNWYDSWQPGVTEHETYKFRSGQQVALFGNRHIGQHVRTNLQAAGYLAADSSNIVEHWYARSLFERHQWKARQHVALDAFEAYCHSAVATLRVGDHPMWQKPVSELLRERPWIPDAVAQTIMTQEEWDLSPHKKRLEGGWKPVIVPVRQSCAIEIQEDPEAAAALVAAVGNDKMPWIWIHIEGFQARCIQ